MSAENEMGVCNTPNRPYMIAEHRDGKFLIFQPRCKMWSCPSCAITNLQRLRVQIGQSAQQLIDDGSTLYFLTLTSSKKLDAEGSWAVWPSAWKKLIERIRYHTERKFAYFMIPEMHRDGRLHMHAIENFGLGTRFFKDGGARCGIGYMNEEQEMYGVGGAVQYVTKYITKTMGDTGEHWPKRARRYRKSRSWPIQKPYYATTWTFNKVGKGERIDDIVQKAIMSGREVIHCDHLTAWEYVQAVDSDNV